MSNRLAAETSPYLRQHADNPVDWYPWGPEALSRARELDRPILLSIGYAACHWCHVMAHESFEDPQTARLMNELFVSIKVDREERPDLDSIYMQAVQAMSGHGGWPMTVFLTPAGEPFWGGTYFPPDDRHGLPSFRRVLSAVADAYDTRPGQIERTVTAVRELYDTTARIVPAGELSAGTFDRAFQSAADSFDLQRGGFGGAPKFPPTMLLEFLLAHWARTGERHALEMAHITHRRMSEGGIHDHVGGGFHRYAVDAEWLVPHFEKMLYDNALLARCGAHLWQATGDPAVRAVTEHLLGWVAREMTAPDGGFHSSLDADSDGEEGLFYTWTSAEFDAALSGDATRARSWFGVTGGGNFEGRNILHTARDAGRVPADVEPAVAHLRAARARRARPGLDDKIVAAWNGLMLRGVATCARVFASNEWTRLALRNARFLEAHVTRDGCVSRILVSAGANPPGFLDDHAAIALGFLETWQLTHERHWLDQAHLVTTAIIDRYWDDDLTAFYDVPRDHERLITRPRDLYDNATPAGSSLAIELLLRMAHITGDPELTRRAGAALAPFPEPMAQHPHAFGYLLTCADLAFHGATALVVVGDSASAVELLAPASAVYLPSFIVGAAADGEHGDLALFENRDSRDAGAAAYVCRGTVCDAPATTPSEVSDQLMRIIPPSR